MLEGPAPTLACSSAGPGGDLKRSSDIRSDSKRSPDISEDNLESKSGRSSKGSKSRTTRRRVRQLMEAMANEMENKDKSMQQLRLLHDGDLSVLLRHLLQVRSTLAREKAEAEAIIRDKDQQIEWLKKQLSLQQSQNNSQQNEVKVSSRNRVTDSGNTVSKPKRISASSHHRCHSYTSSDSSPSSPNNTMHRPLRMSLSTPNNSSNSNSSNSNNRRKGILKVSTSYGNLAEEEGGDSNNARSSTAIMDSLQKLINSSEDKNKRLSEDRSDSGRESEDPELSTSPPTITTTSSSRSASMTPSPPPPPPPPQFYDSGTGDSMLSPDVTSDITKLPLPPPPPPPAINMSEENSNNNNGFGDRRELTRVSARASAKPRPPPRSSTTRLTSSLRRPHSTFSLNSLQKPLHPPPLPPPPLPPTEVTTTTTTAAATPAAAVTTATTTTTSGKKSKTLVTVNRDPVEEKAKNIKQPPSTTIISIADNTVKNRRVKFHPEVDARREKRAIKLLDASINNNSSNNNNSSSKSRSKKRESQLGSISYYEPCL